MRGLDYSWTHVPAAAVKAAGFRFAGRYLSHDVTKALGNAETRGLLAEGIAIVVVWEDGAQDALRGFSGGITDALNAAEQARACELAGIPIYFAVDWDATEAEQGLINAYLDGAASVIGRAQTGIYGGYWPLSRARAAGKATWFWGTFAWSGTNWLDHAGTFVPHIMQGAQVTVDGVQVDLDESNVADFGQWPRPVPLKPPAPKPLPEGFAVPGTWKYPPVLSLNGAVWIAAGIGENDCYYSMASVGLNADGTLKWGPLHQITGPVSIKP